MGHIPTKLHQFLSSGFWNIVRTDRRTDRQPPKTISDPSTAGAQLTITTTGCATPSVLTTYYMQGKRVRALTGKHLIAHSFDVISKPSWLKMHLSVVEVCDAQRRLSINWYMIHVACHFSSRRRLVTALRELWSELRLLPNSCYTGLGI